MKAEMVKTKKDLIIWTIESTVEIICVSGLVAYMAAIIIVKNK